MLQFRGDWNQYQFNAKLWYPFLALTDCSLYVFQLHFDQFLIRWNTCALFLKASLTFLSLVCTMKISGVLARAGGYLWAASGSALRWERLAFRRPGFCAKEAFNELSEPSRGASGLVLPKRRRSRIRNTGVEREVWIRMVNFSKSQCVDSLSEDDYCTPFFYVLRSDAVGNVICCIATERGEKRLLVTALCSPWELHKNTAILT